MHFKIALTIHPVSANAVQAGIHHSPLTTD
jgi:hypothetical protein